MLINSSLLNWIKNAFTVLTTVVVTSGFLIQEDGFNLLQENSDRIEL